MENFKVIIVEDVPLELKGTQGIIRNDIPEAEIIGTAENEPAYWRLVKQQLPVGHMLGRRTRKQHWHKCQEQQSCQYVSSLNRHLQSRQHRLTRLVHQINAQS